MQGTVDGSVFDFAPTKEDSMSSIVQYIRAYDESRIPGLAVMLSSLSAVIYFLLNGWLW